MRVKKVLFICRHNSGRSQMAEAFLNTLGEGRFQAESAGLDPRPVDPRVVDAMAEIGYDLSHQASKDVFSFFREGRLYDAVITVCDVDTEKDCPVFPGIVRRLSWPFADPALVTGDEEEKMEKVRGIRDAIMTVVADFAVDETGACNGESG